MEEELSRIHTGFYLDKELLRDIDYFMEQSNSRSRNEFVRKAVEFYIGYLKADGNIEYLAPAIKKLVGSTVRASEDKISQMLFKIAVELGKLSNMVAATNRVDDETLQTLHLMCVDEVKKLNGIITYENAVKSMRE